MGEVLPLQTQKFRTHAPSQFPPQVRHGSWMEQRIAENRQPQVDVAVGALLGLHIHRRIRDLHVSEVTMRALRVTPEELRLGALSVVQKDAENLARLTVSPCGETITDGGRLYPLSTLEEDVVAGVGEITALHSRQLDIGREILLGRSDVPYLDEPIVLPRESAPEAALRTLPQTMLAAAAVL